MVKLVKYHQFCCIFLLLSRKNSSNWQKLFYNSYINFLLIWRNFPSKWKSKWSAKLLHSLGAANVLQIILIFDLTENWAIAKQFQSIWRIFFVKPRGNAAKLMIFHQHNYNSELISYLVNSIAIQLRDRRLGGIWFLQTLGSHFIPRGFAPWDEMTPAGCKNHSLPLGDHAILYCYIVY